MIEDSFDSRTRARMTLALERVCEGTINGATHAVRKRVASQIIKCASSGKTSLDELMAAGQRAVSRMARAPKDRVRGEAGAVNHGHTSS
jgi:hypothetical protein